VESLLIFILFVAIAGAVFEIVRLRQRLADARLANENHERERRTVFQFLNRIGEDITRKVEVEATLNLVVEFCMEATSADAGAIFVKDDETPEILQARVVQGLFPPLHEVSSDKLLSKRRFLAEYVKREKLRVGEGVIGQVAQSGQTLLIPDASADERVPKSAGELVPLEGLILAPLAVRGAVQGVLVLINKRVEGVTFDEMDRDLVTALANQAAVTLDIVRLYQALSEKQRLEQELLVAQEFQALLLPQETPDLAELEVAGHSQAALEVGGDYFDYIPVGERKLGLAIGDVAGKGIPGALVMATLRACLRAEARGDASPRSVLSRVNRQLLMDTKENIFVSLLYGIIDLDAGTFRFARAGHEPAVTCSPEERRIRTHLPDGMVVGMTTGPAFDLLAEEEIDLKRAGLVVLNTDGVTEAMNGNYEEFGEDRFHRAVVERCQEPAPDVIEGVLDDIASFTRGIPQHDDITLVVMRWRGPS